MEVPESLCGTHFSKRLRNLPHVMEAPHTPVLTACHTVELHLN